MNQQQDAISWAQFEFGQAQLIDERLNKRLVKIVSDFYRQPNASIPQASGSAAQAQAAYNFFQNEFIEPEQILESHLQRTIERCQEEKTVLMMNDTTYLDFSTQPAKKGMGTLAKKNSWGMLAHPTFAVSPAGVPLGVIDVQVWSRAKDEFGKSEQRQQRLIAEKESQKWLNSYLATAKIQAQQADTSFVVIGDREADVFELFELTQSDDIPMTPDGKRPDLLIRAAQDRRVTSTNPCDPNTSRIWETMEKQTVAGTYQLEVPRHDKQPERTTEIEVRFAKLTILPPKNRTNKERLPITLWAIWAQETKPPEGVEPISWMLLTTIPINSLQDAIEKIFWYKLRWLIELLFKILKSGCCFEKRQLETADRLHKCLVIDIIIAWRILYMIKIGREHPNLPCTALFDDGEWKALYCFVNNTTVLPNEVPTLHQAVRMVARLGGFLDRKNDGEPGIISLWRGLHRLNDISLSFRLFYANPTCQVKVMRNG
jgi:hypothetical protein